MKHSDAQAVVIGAGALGLSTALQLARKGVRDVVVVDKYEPGSQTSPRAAGLFKLVQPDLTRTALARLSIDIARHFEEQTGVPLPFVASGSIMLARDHEHAEMIRNEVTQSRAWGIDVELISPLDAHRFMPCLEPGGIEVACYTPGDIYIEEPASLLHAYADAARGLGVRILGYTPVTGIDLSAGRVRGVMTDQGDIITPLVVDAAGAWARLVGQMAQVQLPVEPVRHQLFITEPIPGIEPEYPIVRIIDTAVYIRPARSGLMLGGFEPDPLPADRNVTDPRFCMDDVPLDRQVLDQLASTVEGQVPVLRGTDVREHRGGLFTMTPDGRFLVGPVPGVQGLWSATGCNGSGFSASPAIGLLLAEWMTEGAPSMDLGILRPERFASQHLTIEQLRAAGTWQYAHYYDPTASQPSSTDAERARV